jgi:hypothetical protein
LFRQSFRFVRYDLCRGYTAVWIGDMLSCAKFPASNDPMAWQGSFHMSINLVLPKTTLPQPLRKLSWHAIDGRVGGDPASASQMTGPRLGEAAGSRTGCA